MVLLTVHKQEYFDVGKKEETKVEKVTKKVKFTRFKSLVEVRRIVVRQVLHKKIITQKICACGTSGVFYLKVREGERLASNNCSTNWDPAKTCFW